jgi:hypothetical protein
VSMCACVLRLFDKTKQKTKGQSFDLKFMQILIP